MKSGKVKSWKVGAVAFAVFVVVGGCGEGEEAPLTSAERQEVALAYADSVRALSKPTDSACEADRPALVAAYVDSLYRLRLADIEAQQSLRE